MSKNTRSEHHYARNGVDDAMAQHVPSVPGEHGSSFSAGTDLASVATIIGLFATRASIMARANGERHDQLDALADACARELT